MEPAVKPSGRKRLLIVDDELSVREILADGLGAMGYETLTAAGASEAFRIIQQERPNAVLTDIEMPGASGFDLLGGAVFRQFTQIIAGLNDTVQYEQDRPVPHIPRRPGEQVRAVSLDGVPRAVRVIDVAIRCDGAAIV